LSEAHKQPLSEAGAILRISSRVLNFGDAIGFIVVTGNPELTHLLESQRWPGGSASEFATQLECALSNGRIILAVCPIFDLRFGRMHCDIHVAQPYAVHQGIHETVHCIVKEFLGLA
jgi:hypothetical protein